jgi:hypothetical protein
VERNKKEKRFVCDAAHLQSRVSFPGVVAGIGVGSVGVDETVVVV